MLNIFDFEKNTWFFQRHEMFAALTKIYCKERHTHPARQEEREVSRGFFAPLASLAV